MADNLTVESPDFDRIQRQAGRETADAIRLLWAEANREAKARRVGVREAVERIEPETLITETTSNQNDYDTNFATILRFDGGSAINVTGIKARVNGAVVIVLVLGAGTHTLKHNSASSEANNRMLFQAGADLAVTTNKGAILIYQDSRWRELKLA